MEFYIVILYLLVILVNLLIILQIINEVKMRRIEGNFLDSVSIIVPIKGEDERLEGNILSLLSQNYPYPYEVIYVVDKGDDVEKVLRKYNVRVVYSDYNCEACSGKIKAQLSGLKYASYNVIVFADSDTWYPKDWLYKLVRPLDKFTATTTFSWPSPSKLSLSNLLRAGFWTLGFESQSLENSRFLWGGSMAFRKSFFNKDVIDELSKEWCDDCTLTRIVKRNNGKIGFLMNCVPLNVYDEKDLVKWSSRQIITILAYSPRGAKAYLVAGTFFTFILVYSIVFLNLVTFTPYILWIVKNVIRGIDYPKNAMIASLMTILAIPYALFLLIYNWNRREVYWRGRKYIVKPLS
ncbi:glycosyl transferase family 2 [Sulfolobus sp. A20]|uniref:glycosyltransferase n=1 Tax=Saccharolobus sp. A20 TaxID=1891280 RepID=UPI00084622AA|nr:glycosyltransferase family 2 protein [Sulfolobus sp. A20]TRM76873.1 glycosyltransferase family 2 protein [Sulfolobus sp. A20-N-F8]TRM88161.1 glycosyltransferase family 2 protein [Sulfolobus sp. C3]TRM88882.1 glycosyltransferase family 2 protein [Sulfolobus sp. E3]TRM94914.1 glycosyltransferase family 2 protein [Sulfolobus sp. A20-N-G8]TRN02111.1 glycosyltransferase family 2 protein [Sulfolobus sp. F1]TRN02931.1 glycosyltransferase family 2 protein [Sulfolobus sp. E1]